VIRDRGEDLPGPHQVQSFSDGPQAAASMVAASLAARG
jgi:hypothetical protein